MKPNLIVDSCVDFNEDTESIDRVPFRILIEDEEIINIWEKVKNISGFYYESPA